METGSNPCDCSRNMPATTPSTVPSSRCSGMVNMMRASLERLAISSATMGLPSTSVRRKASRAGGSRFAVFSKRPFCRLTRNSPSCRATSMESKNCTAGRLCCSSHSRLAGSSSISGVIPSATLRSTFWLCSILLAKSRANTSTSSVCWSSMRCTASCPDARATNQPETAPDSAMARAASTTSRSASAPGSAQWGAVVSATASAASVGGVMRTPNPAHAGGARKKGVGLMAST